MSNQLLTESSLSKLYRKMAKWPVVGIVTAYRGDLVKKENQNRNRQLMSFLTGKGYSVTSVKGSYIENMGSENEKEVGEHSFFVSPTGDENTDSIGADIIAAGKKFDQDSVLIIKGKDAYLIGTSRRSDAWPSYGQKAPVGSFKGGKTSEFMTRIKNRPFVFGEEQEIPSFSRWNSFSK